ncbi:MAG: hypothetical protein ACLQOO_09985 [Terriglobia bacterium]
MTIEIHRPELEALIIERMKTGGLEDVILHALKSAPFSARKTRRRVPAWQGVGARAG